MAGKQKLHSKIFPPRLAHDMVLKKYLELPRNDGRIKASYIAIMPRSKPKEVKMEVDIKMKTLDKYPENLDDVPVLPVDEVTFHPVAMFRDPFSATNDVIILCEVYEVHTKNPVYRTEKRVKLREAMKVEEVEKKEPMFELTQEYTLERLLKPDSLPYIDARSIVEAHYHACMYAGILINTANSFQKDDALYWSYSIGPTDGMKAADHLWVSRYILARICDEFGVHLRMTEHKNKTQLKQMYDCEFALYPHSPRVLFALSTKGMRENGGIRLTRLNVKKLEYNHNEDLIKYDVNDLDSREVQEGLIQIPAIVKLEGKGPLVDTRPAARTDPYTVITAMLERCIFSS